MCAFGFFFSSSALCRLLRAALISVLLCLLSPSNWHSLSLPLALLFFPCTRRVSIAGNNAPSQQIFPHWCDFPQHFPLPRLALIFLLLPLAFSLSPSLCIFHVRFYILFVFSSHFHFLFSCLRFFCFLNLCVIKPKQINFWSTCVCVSVCVSLHFPACLFIHDFYFDPVLKKFPFRQGKQIDKLKQGNLLKSAY